jgi:protein tyrosine phosphatase
MPLEENKLKCDDYWSHRYWEEQGVFTITDGNTILGTLTKHLHVPDEIIDSSGNERIVKRNFEFTSSDDRETRIITQFHYENWPDRDVPKDVVLFEKLLDIVDKSGSKKGPPIIHCSAGIGRTGTFIVTDFELKQIKQQVAKQVAPNVDPMQVIKEIRQYRNGMVQMQQQLEMIYSIIFRFGQTLGKETMDDNSQNLITNLNKV